MTHTKLVLVVASCLVIAAPTALAGGDNDGQQARDHAKEVHRLKEHTREHEHDRREQAEKDRHKVKEHVREEAEAEEGFGNDLDDDGVDGSE